MTIRGAVLWLGISTILGCGSVSPPDPSQGGAANVVGGEGGKAGSGSGGSPGSNGGEAGSPHADGGTDEGEPGGSGGKIPNDEGGSSSGCDSAGGGGTAGGDDGSAGASGSTSAGSGGSSAGSGGSGVGGSAGAPPDPLEEGLQWIGPCTPVSLSEDAKTVLALEGVWTEATGWTPLPDLPGGAVGNTPRVLSGNGRVVYGDSASPLGREIYRYEVDAGTIRGLGREYENPLANDPPDVPESVRSIDTNYDGSSMVGVTAKDENRLYRWTVADGFSVIPVESARANMGGLDTALMSSNSETLAFGGVFFGAGNNDMVLISTLPVTIIGERLIEHSYPVAVSGDGRIVSSYTTEKGPAFDSATCLGWSNACTLVSHPVMAFSYDGSASVGKEYYTAAAIPTGTFYSAVAGPYRHLSEALFEHGVYADVRTFSRAGISADGKSILASATRHFADGSQGSECFIARFGDAIEPTPSSGPTLPAPELGAIGAHARMTCAVQADGAVRCWGAGANGLTGGPPRDAWTSVLVPSLPPAVQVALGGEHTCAVLADRTVRCWGNNDEGQLGNGSTNASSTPTVVSGLADVSRIAAGRANSCALRENGEVWCWGEGPWGTPENVNHSPIPVLIAGVPAATSIASGAYSTCAVSETGEVWCWSLDPEDPPMAFGPAPITGLSDVTQVALSGSHACASLTNGTVRCWGERFGSGEPFWDESTESAVPVFTGAVTQISVGTSHLCAVLEGGTVECLGWNARGQLGRGNHLFGTQGAPVTSVSRAVQVAAAGAHTCALLETGKVQCWGGDDAGQLGIGRVYVNAPAGLSWPVDVLGFPAPF